MAAPIFHMAAGAPTPVAPFSHAVEADGWVFVTGQMPNDPNDEAAPLPAGIEGQTRNVMANLKTVLASLGLGLEHVIVARVYLTHFNHAAMNAVYETAAAGAHVRRCHRARPRCPCRDRSAGTTAVTHESGNRPCYVPSEAATGSAPDVVVAMLRPAPGNRPGT